MLSGTLSAIGRGTRAGRPGSLTRPRLRCVDVFLLIPTTFRGCVAGEAPRPNLDRDPLPFPRCDLARRAICRQGYASDRYLEVTPPMPRLALSPSAAMAELLRNRRMQLGLTLREVQEQTGATG